MKTKPPYHLRPLPLALAVGMFFAGLSAIPIAHTSAAPFTQVQVRTDRLKPSTATGGRVCAKSSTTATEGKVLVTFPTNAATDYSLSATLADWVATGVADASISASAWPGLSNTNATSVSGKTVTWTSGDLVAGTLYCFNFGATATPPLTLPNNNTENSPGVVATQTSTSTAIDSSYFSIGVSNTSASGDDQITITNSVVPPIFTFSLNGNTDAFASNLSTSSVVSTAGKTVTVSTNAAKGYIVWARNANSSGGRGSLFSSTANSYIPGNGNVGTPVRTLTPGTTDYGLGVTANQNTGGGSTGTFTISSSYDSTASTLKAGTLDPTGYQTILTSNGVANADTVTLTERAAINGLTKAANDYGDVITVVGAGMF